jgi:hypothetical protein
VGEIYVVSFRDKIPPGVAYIDTTSRSKSPFSPFLSGCKEPIRANRMENAWQYSKVYTQHDDDGQPNKEWSRWRYEGLNKFWADRYPCGRGAIPLYTWYNDQKLDYIEARKQLFVPLYRDMLDNNTVAQHEINGILQLLKRMDVYLQDFDGYNDPDKSFDEIINDPDKKMGHAFVLREVLKERQQK